MLVTAAPAGKAGENSSQFLEQKLTKSDRPELAGAKTVISGGQCLIFGPFFFVLAYFCKFLFIFLFIFSSVLSTIFHNFILLFSDVRS